MIQNTDPRASLSVPAPPFTSPDWGFWGVGKGLDRQALAGLAVNYEGGKAVLGRPREVLGRPNRGMGRHKKGGFSFKINRLYSIYIYLGSLGRVYNTHKKNH